MEPFRMQRKPKEPPRIIKSSHEIPEAIKVGLAPYSKAIKATAVIFAIFSLMTFTIVIATKIKVAFNASNLLCSFHLITAFLSIAWINERLIMSARIITARFWVCIVCIILNGVYIILQMSSIISCGDEAKISVDPVFNYLCEHEYAALLSTIIFAFLVVLASIAQAVIDISIRTFLLRHADEKSRKLGVSSK